VISDPTGQCIRHIIRHCDITDKTVLIVGCGKVRVTEDLARHTRKIKALDPDEKALAAAKARIASGDVEFSRGGGDTLEFPEQSFDIVIYPLSLHHIPVHAMQSSLKQAAGLLREEGKIIVIEPGAGGTLIESEERFCVGDGNERGKKEAAQSALESLDGWEKGANIHFQTFFHFDSRKDFLDNLLPWHRLIPESTLHGIGSFLKMHQENGRIILYADRKMNILTRKNQSANDGVQ